MAAIGPINATTKKYSVRGQLCEVRVATEFRDGCIWRTKVVGFVIASLRQPCVSGNGLQGSVSTDYTKALMEARHG